MQVNQGTGPEYLIRKNQDSVLIGPNLKHMFFTRGEIGIYLYLAKY